MAIGFTACSTTDNKTPIVKANHTDTLYQEIEANLSSESPVSNYLRQREVLQYSLNELIPMDSCLSQALAAQNEANPDRTNIAPLDIHYDIQAVNKHKNPTMLFYILASVFLFLIVTRQIFTTYIDKMYKSFFNANLAKQFFNDFSHNNPLLNVLLHLNIVLVLSTFVYLSMRFFNKLHTVDNQQLMLIIFFATAVYIAIRRLLLGFSAFILPVKESIQFYIFNLKLLNNMLVVVLLPFLILLAFANDTLAYFAYYTILLILFAFILYLLRRGSIIGKDYIIFHKFHFFLYLCTFEIVPLLILYKITHICIN
ncbi:MAG: DUF4271 domain-containing protein [Chitinophagales bacterium]